MERTSTGKCDHCVQAAERFFLGISYLPCFILFTAGITIRTFVGRVPVPQANQDDTWDKCPLPGYSVSPSELVPAEPPIPFSDGRHQDASTLFTSRVADEGCGAGRTEVEVPPTADPQRSGTASCIREVAGFAPQHIA
eukprot:jgi/Botrbrau1/1545/Bobra.0107s0033.1